MDAAKVDHKYCRRVTLAYFSSIMLNGNGNGDGPSIMRGVRSGSDLCVRGLKG